MTQYSFWLTPIDEETFRLLIAQTKGDQRVCLNAAALVWEALLPFGDLMTPHPTTGETPNEFRAKHLELSAEDLFARMKPSMLAELYSDLEETAESQEGEALVETQRIARIVHAELLPSVGADDARERIEWARLNT